MTQEEQTKILSLLDSQEESNWLLGIQLSISLFGVNATYDWLNNELEKRITNTKINTKIDKMKYPGAIQTDAISLAGFKIFLEYTEHLTFKALYPKFVDQYVSIIERMGATIPHCKKDTFRYFNNYIGCLILLIHANNRTNTTTT